MSWQHYAEQLNGKTYTTDDGVEVQLIIATGCDGTYSSTINGNPTKKGKRSTYYQEKKRAYRDDWGYCWQGEVPESLSKLVQ